MNVPISERLTGLPAALPLTPAPAPKVKSGMPVQRLMANESPFPVHPTVVNAINEAALGVRHYPDRGAQKLREAIAKKRGVKPEQVLVSAGSSMLLVDIFRAVVEPGEEVVMPWRSFELFPTFTQMQGGVIKEVPLTAEGDHDFPAMLAAITERTRIVIICLPNNPSGVYPDRNAVEEFMAQVPEDVLIILDEAYREFVDPDRLIDTNALLEKYPNAISLGTFSKLYGLAGLRIGYSLASAEFNEALSRSTVLFTVNGVAQAAALATFEPEVQAEMEKQVAYIVAERARVSQQLQALGYRINEAQGNSINLLTGAESDELAALLEANGLITRLFPGESVRVTVSLKETNDLFLKLCAAFLEGERA